MAIYGPQGTGYYFYDDISFGFSRVERKSPKEVRGEESFRDFLKDVGITTRANYDGPDVLIVPPKLEKEAQSFVEETHRYRMMTKEELAGGYVQVNKEDLDGQFEMIQEEVYNQMVDAHRMLMTPRFISSVGTE